MLWGACATYVTPRRAGPLPTRVSCLELHICYSRRPLGFTLETVYSPPPTLVNQNGRGEGGPRLGVQAELLGAREAGARHGRRRCLHVMDD